MTLTIALLAGGKSQRFGQDKAALFLPSVLTACQPTGLPQVIVGRAELPGVPEAVPFLPDDLPDQGPLGGIVTALRHTQSPVLALACDLPYLQTEALTWLIARWQQASAPEILVAAHSEPGGALAYEPLFAIYAPACLATAEQLLATGRRSLHQLLAHAQTEHALLPEHLRAQLRNVNTPADLVA